MSDEQLDRASFLLAQLQKEVQKIETNNLVDHLQQAHMEAANHLEQMFEKWSERADRLESQIKRHEQFVTQRFNESEATFITSLLEISQGFKTILKSVAKVAEKEIKDEVTKARKELRAKAKKHGSSLDETCEAQTAILQSALDKAMQSTETKDLVATAVERITGAIGDAQAAFEKQFEDFMTDVGTDYHKMRHQVIRNFESLKRLEVNST